MKPHDANQAFGDASAQWWKEKEDQRGLWMKAHEDPTLVISPAEMPFVNDIDQKDVCVLGSGDNEVPSRWLVSAVMSPLLTSQSTGLLLPRTGLAHSDCNWRFSTRTYQGRGTWREDRG